MNRRRIPRRRATQGSRLSWRGVRITVLSILLVFIALGAWLSHHYATDWDRPLWVVVFPINADGSAVSAAYIDALSRESFAPIEQYLADQARRYDLPLATPAEIRLGPQLRNLPPTPPYNGNMLSVIAWSLRMRWWAWRAADAYDGPPISIRLFVLYHDPATSPRLSHSLGLKEGLIGVVNAFATRTMSGSNRVVITHELLHTLGATDKYDPETGLPRHPDGYAAPDQTPLYPQSQAELMAGRVPRSASRAEIPANLSETLIGPATAREIGWLQ